MILDEAHRITETLSISVEDAFFAYANIDIKTQEVSFALPDFGLGYKNTYISPEVWESCSNDLLRSEEAWGIIELGYLFPSDDKKAGRIQMLDFHDFCPYNIDLDEFKDARSVFTLEEWIDIVLAAADYNPKGYESMTQKLAVMQRLLPFVEKNLNLIELAPPGTGKSYVLWKFGTLCSSKIEFVLRQFNLKDKGGFILSTTGQANVCTTTETDGQANVCTTTETENESPTNTCDLETIKIEIKKYQESSNEAYLEIGRLLLKVKEIEAHGRWIPWIKENTDFSICKAQRLMRIAKWIDGNEAPVPHLDFSKAYILSRLTGNDLETFLRRFHHVGGKCAKNVESMTKTELAKAVHNYLKSKGHKSSSAQVSQQAESHTSTEDDFLNRFGRIKSDVSKLASLIEDNSAGYGTFAADLCKLCQEIIQQLSSDDVEDS